MEKGPSIDRNFHAFSRLLHSFSCLEDVKCPSKTCSVTFACSDDLDHNVFYHRYEASNSCSGSEMTSVPVFVVVEFPVHPLIRTELLGRA